MKSTSVGTQQVTDTAKRPAFEWVEDAPLPNTLRLPAWGERMLVLNDVSERTLTTPVVADWLADRATRVAAGGSNVVFATPRISQTVMIAACGWSIEPTDADTIDLSVEAGMGLDALVRATAESGWFGLEALAEIPGTVGAAPMQNVGAYGTEIAERTRWVEAWDRRERRVERFARDACDFSYRHSRFKREPGRWLILRVGLSLSTTPPADWPPVAYPGVDEAVRDWSAQSGRARSTMSPSEYAALITSVRRTKLPDWRRGWPGSAGSFFHNPIVTVEVADRLSGRWPDMPRFDVPGGVKIPAGWLIEAAGLKGHREGAVAVSLRHALVIEHHGGATGAEFLRFAESVRDRVEDVTGIRLVVEPECVSVS
ncbi:FAD-binding protein [Guyparkeria halophila]|uniref:UDP-N-acetylenolpyruvoylglucosamine reductase n=1 Tax=Guyparkeria halophila TaxID=47960 RepID=A0ABZ0YTH7_9GAMM|nr:FAD-binding protein [Guyparkeria halophila]WQH15475.1 FAD-binding protein [Guyparkeria halophila]